MPKWMEGERDGTEGRQEERRGEQRRGQEWREEEREIDLLTLGL